MKKYNSIIYILSLACAGLILIGCETTQPGAATAPLPPNSGRLLVYRVANFGAISALSCLLMARTWEALPRAETTVATCRQASTSLPPGLIPIKPVPVRREKL